MKKLIPLLTGAIMLLSLAACGSRTAAPEATTAPAAAGGKTLVVYFSATGSTKTAAEAIAAATGGDLLELEPAEPYTSADLDYNNADSRVSREHDDETLRDVALKTTTADNWADYDTVYIGYPIWWGIAAWPVDTFVKANDFTGKTVIPFCTSASSGIGESGAQLAALAGTGDWPGGPALPLRRHAAGSHRLGQVPRQMTAAAQNRIPGRRKNRRPGIFANLYLIYTRFFVISLHFRLKYAIFSPSGSAGLRDISCRRCTTADHAAGKLSESERMTRYAARNTRRPVPARWRARLELGYGAQSHQSPIWHQLHDQRTAAVLSPPSAAKT